jgi:hypothetical protein
MLLPTRAPTELPCRNRSGNRLPDLDGQRAELGDTSHQGVAGYHGTDALRGPRVDQVAWFEGHLF